MILRKYMQSYEEELRRHQRNDILRRHMQSYEEELRQHQRNDILIRDIQPYMDSPHAISWMNRNNGVFITDTLKSNTSIINLMQNDIGTYNTKIDGVILSHYVQNKLVGITDLNSDIGKKFRMIAAEGGWVKDADGHTIRETQYGLYIIGASIENRLKLPKLFPNNGTNESLFNSTQYNAVNGNTYKNLTSQIDQWKMWYGVADFMDYLNAVYNASNGNCVKILQNSYSFAYAQYILGYAHKNSVLFGKYTVYLDFDKGNTLIKTVQSSWSAFPELQKI